MQLSANQRRQFDDEGYVVVKDLFTSADLQPVIDELRGEIDRRARRLVADGTLSRTYAEEGFETRLSRIMDETEELYWSISSGKLDGPALFDLLVHPGLLELIEGLVGPEIISSAYRLRPKVPGFYHGIVPWHQDSGYFEPFCDRALLVTVWIPLVDATPERGCLQVIPGVHRGPIAEHVRRPEIKYLEIPSSAMPAGDAVTVPVPKGGALLLTNRTPHCSTENTTDVIRWSLDFRYQGGDAPTNFEAAPGEPFRERQPDEPPACYPPEADFLVRSRARPEAVVRTWERFQALRRGHASLPLTARWP